MHRLLGFHFSFFFNDTATTEIYTLSLHDALPISFRKALQLSPEFVGARLNLALLLTHLRSEEHTSELQSQSNLVCRLLLEKKKSSFAESAGDPSPRRPDCCAECLHVSNALTRAIC